MLDFRIVDLREDAGGRADLERVEDRAARGRRQVFENLGEIGRVDSPNALLRERQTQAGGVGQRRRDVFPADQFLGGEIPRLPVDRANGRIQPFFPPEPAHQAAQSDVDVRQDHLPLAHDQKREVIDPFELGPRDVDDLLV